MSEFSPLLNLKGPRVDDLHLNPGSVSLSYLNGPGQHVPLWLTVHMYKMQLIVQPISQGCSDDYLRAL